MSLTILSVAYPFAPAGLQSVGGAEQVLGRIDAGLTRLGHSSIVVACEGSTVEGTLVATPRFEALIDDTKRDTAHASFRGAIASALERWPVDVVHMHGLDFFWYMPERVPLVATLHLPPTFYPREIFQMDRPNTIFTCVSLSERARCPDTRTPIAVIQNGIEIPPPSEATRGDYAVALGRICPEKGFHLALDAARIAGVPMVLAGKVFPHEAHLKYFEREIIPRLDQQRRFVGPVRGAEKIRLLSSAKCLLVPSRVAETSSLVSMEALACGTPVIAFRSGALPEVVDDGRTGFLVNDEREMAAAIARGSDIDSHVCREVARSRFSADAMVARYVELYRTVASRRQEEAAAL